MFNLSSKDIQVSHLEETYRYRHSPFFHRITKGEMSYLEAGARHWINWFKSLYR